MVVLDYGHNVDNAEISIYDIQGRQVLSKKLGFREGNNKEEEIGSLLSSDLSSGIYFVQFKCDNTILNKKFTILK